MATFKLANYLLPTPSKTSKTSDDHASTSITNSNPQAMKEPWRKDANWVPTWLWALKWSQDEQSLVLRGFGVTGSKDRNLLWGGQLGYLAFEKSSAWCQQNIWAGLFLESVQNSLVRGLWRKNLSQKLPLELKHRSGPKQCLHEFPSVTSGGGPHWPIQSSSSSSSSSSPCLRLKIWGWVPPLQCINSKLWRLQRIGKPEPSISCDTPKRHLFPRASPPNKKLLPCTCQMAWNSLSIYVPCVCRARRSQFLTCRVCRS